MVRVLMMVFDLVLTMVRVLMMVLLMVLKGGFGKSLLLQGSH